MLKKILLLTGIPVSFLLLITSCSIYRQGVELKTFSQCNFTVQSVKVMSIAGVNVGNIQKVTDLPLNDYIFLAKQAFSKNVPSKLLIKLNASNSTNKKAAVNGFDWELYLKGALYTKGSVNKSIVVLPEQSASFEMPADINIMEIIQSKSLPQLLALIIEKNDNLNLSDLDAVVRIKPWYISGKNIKKYPGFIRIKL